MYHIYNDIMVIPMKNESVNGILQLVLSVIVYYVIDNYFLFFLNKIHFSPTGDLLTTMILVKYILICVLIFLIYKSNISGSKHKSRKSKITSIIFSVGACILLVFANFLLHKVIAIFHEVPGYGFVNYFGETLTYTSIVELIIEILLKPFITVIIFILGTSNIIKNVASASLISGVLYGVVIALGLHTSIESSFFIVVIPSLIIMLLTYLYKNYQNIWLIYLSFVLYMAFGSYILRYFV